MKKGDQEWESGVESIERDLYYNIDMSFTHLKNNFPSLESVYGKKNMDNWYDFIKWTCAQEYPEDIDFKKELDIEISPLMSSSGKIIQNKEHTHKSKLELSNKLSIKKLLPHPTSIILESLLIKITNMIKL